MYFIFFPMKVTLINVKKIYVLLIHGLIKKDKNYKCLKKFNNGDYRKLIVMSKITCS